MAAPDTTDKRRASAAGDHHACRSPGLTAAADLHRLLYSQPVLQRFHGLCPRLSTRWLMWTFVFTTVIRIYWSFFGAGSAPRAAAYKMARFPLVQPASDTKGEAKFRETIKYYLFLRKTYPVGLQVQPAAEVDLPVLGFCPDTADAAHRALPLGADACRSSSRSPTGSEGWRRCAATTTC